MKHTFISIATLALAAICGLSACNNAKPAGSEAASGEEVQTAGKGAIVYVDLSRISQEYDMANDKMAVFNTKRESVEQEINRRGKALEKDAKTFQEKIDKGTILASTAQVQGQKLQQRQAELQNYAAQKQNELAEEAQVLQNQINDAISVYIKKFREQNGYSLVIATQSDNVISLPVIAAESALDVTDAVLEGLNAEYVKEKSGK